MKATGLVWIASYPRSGNTWVRSLIVSLRNGGVTPDINALYKDSPFSANRYWLEDITGVSIADLTAVEQKKLRRSAHIAVANQSALSSLVAPGTFCTKVHDWYDSFIFPEEVTAGAIYIVRDPRDVAPSVAAHFGWPLDASIRYMGQIDFSYPRNHGALATSVEEPLGSWSQNVSSWLDGYKGPLLLLHYEELQSDPTGQAARLAQFLGLPDDAKTIASAVMATRFSVLQQAEARGDFFEGKSGSGRFFRRGTTGGWRIELTSAQADILERCHGDTMRRLGYSLDGSSGTQAIA